MSFEFVSLDVIHTHGTSARGLFVVTFLLSRLHNFAVFILSHLRGPIRGYLGPWMFSRSWANGDLHVGSLYKIAFMFGLFVPVFQA